MKAGELFKLFTNAADIGAKFVIRFEGYTFGSTDPQFIPDPRKWEEYAYHRVLKWMTIILPTKEEGEENPSLKYLIILVIDRAAPIDHDVNINLERDSVLELFDLNTTLQSPVVDAIQFYSVNNDRKYLSSIEILYREDAEYEDQDSPDGKSKGRVLVIKTTSRDQVSKKEEASKDAE